LARRFARQIDAGATTKSEAALVVIQCLLLDLEPTWIAPMLLDFASMSATDKAE
jgi:hypothetical protein